MDMNPEIRSNLPNAAAGELVSPPRMVDTARLQAQGWFVKPPQGTKAQPGFGVPQGQNDHRVKAVVSAPSSSRIHVDDPATPGFVTQGRSVAVEYCRPSRPFGRATSGVVIGLLYLLMAVDGVTIALLGLASFLGLVLKFASWVLGSSLGVS